MKHWDILPQFTILVNSFPIQEFQQFGYEAVEKSEKYYENKIVTLVDAIPEFFNFFTYSALVVSKIAFILWILEKRRFQHLVSNLKKRRFHQIEQDNCKEKFKELKTKSLKDYKIIMNLREKQTNFRDKHLESGNNGEELSCLYELKIIYFNGDYFHKINDDQWRWKRVIS